MTLRELVVARMTFTQMVGELIEYATGVGIPVIIDWVLRDRRTQRDLYEAGASTTLRSRHLNGLAVDLYVIDVGDHVIAKDGTDERYEQLGEFWEKIGGTWGGRWESLKDFVHFEFFPYEEG